jgi:ubiquinone biosynthesis protein COQ9
VTQGIPDSPLSFIMASSSLRTRILHHALTHVPEHSFTLRPLLNSLSALPASHIDHDLSVSPEVLDVLFGSELNARQDLVREWEDEGLRYMVDSKPAPLQQGIEKKGKARELDTIAEVLRRRLEYSSRIGEHLVEVGLDILTDIRFQAC